MKREARQLWQQTMGRWKRPLLAVLMLFLSLVVFQREVGFLFQRDPTVIAEVTETFNYGVIRKPEAVEVEGFDAGPRGWSLPPHTSGRLIYNSPVDPQTAVSIFPLFYRPSRRVKNALKVSVDSGKTFTTIARNVHLLGSRIDLTPYLSSGETFTLLFEATNGGASHVLILDKMELRAFKDPPSVPPSPLSITVAFLSFGLAMVLWTPNWKRALPLLLILSLAFFFRYVNFERVIYSPLDADAQAYKLFAERILLGESGFYSANFRQREPFYPLVAKAFFQIFGSSETHLRYLSLFLSLAVVVLTFRLARALFGYGVGLLAAAAMALNVPLIVESGRGLRLELEMILLLSFCYVGFVKGGMKPISRFLGLGLLGGLIVVTRSAYLPGLAILSVAAAWKEERPMTQVALMAFLTVFLMGATLAPHRYAMHRRHGDPFWDVNKMVRWFANMEFAGKPGFPIREEVEKNAYVGPRITSTEYLFQLHTPAEVSLSVGRGAMKIMSNMDVVGHRKPVAAILGFDPGWVDHVLTAVGVVGFIFALCFPGLRWLPLTFLALTLHTAFFYDRGLFGRDSYRLIMQGFPFFLLSAMHAIQRCSAWAKAKALNTPRLAERFDFKHHDAQQAINPDAGLLQGSDDTKSEFSGS